MNITLTGATGFVGKAVLEKINDTHRVHLLVRNRQANLANPQSVITINSEAIFTPCLTDSDVVIHCAARAHILNDNAKDSRSAYLESNTKGTLLLAEQAASCGVKRFIFVSTVKVNGEATYLSPFTANDPHQAIDSYGESKSLAENGLWEIAQRTNMEVVIIRPPLVYGPGVKANFAFLMKIVDSRLPLPFGLIKSNKRSMVYIGNLVDLIVTCIDHPSAGNETFMVSDDNDLSTYCLVLQLGKSLNKRPLQLPLPVEFLRTLGKLTGKSELIERLVGSLQVDIQHTKDILAWIPPFTVEQGMSATAEAIKKTKK